MQLLGKVRWTTEDPIQGDLLAIQKVQNKMVRLLNGKSLMDKISTKKLLSDVNMLSVNQLNAQIKITEVWKAVQDQHHPMKIEKVIHGESSCLTRSVVKGDLKEFGKTEIVQSTYLSDACKVWNKCPKNIKESLTLGVAKKTIKAFVTTLPI